MRLGQQHSERAMIEAMRRHAAPDGTLTTRRYRELRAAEEPAPNTIMARFGTWNEALTAAGLAITRPGLRQPRRTNEEILDAMRRAARGGTLTAAQFEACRDAADPPASTIIYRFGSWAEASRAAGLRVHPRSRREAQAPSPRELILGDLRSWAAEHGRTPGPGEWDRRKGARVTRKSIVNHFGSFAAAVQAAGLTTTEETNDN